MNDTFRKTDLLKADSHLTSSFSEAKPLNENAKFVNLSCFCCSIIYLFQLSAVVDGVYADHSHIAGKFTMLSSSRVYVGGSLNTRALPGARVHNNFVGCMRKASEVSVAPKTS